MNYGKLKESLLSYGRRSNFAYVSDSYRPHLRQDKKFKQWKRLLNKVTIKSFSDKEREVLAKMLDCRIVHSQWACGLL